MAITSEKWAEAKKVYDALVAHLHDIKLNFETEEKEDRYLIRFNMSGDDIPMRFYWYVEPEKQCLTIHSPQPVTFAEDKIDLACKALCAINYRLTDGDFQIDLRDGEVVYNMINCYAGCQVGTDLFNYMLGMSINIVDEFNDQLLMLSKGLVELDTFLKKLDY